MERYEILGHPTPNPEGLNAIRERMKSCAENAPHVKDASVQLSHIVDLVSFATAQHLGLFSTEQINEKLNLALVGAKDYFLGEWRDVLP